MYVRRYGAGRTPRDDIATSTWHCIMRSTQAAVLLSLALVLSAPQPAEGFFGKLTQSMDKVKGHMTKHIEQRAKQVATLEASSGGVFYTSDSDPLGKAGVHVPTVEVQHGGALRTVVISLPDGMEPGQWVDAVWARDQNGKIVHLKQFKSDPGTPHPGTCVHTVVLSSA